ncbi:hypothetical protein BJV74DRAFT_484015 [Russula compacta]|nr:hypothetical protein BJV74DRAFT_484015 [Russula compacta]
MPPNTEVRVTSDGIPYVVEFANVSIWPRPPMVHADISHRPADLAPKAPLLRSNTMPTTMTHKPLPSLPLPVRSRSLKLFRNKISIAATEPDSTRPIIRRNPSFAADARNSAHRHFKIFNDEFSASEETLVEFEAAVSLTPPAPFPPSPTTSDVPSGVPSSEPETEGMSQVDFEKTTRLQLYRLSRAISKAVLAAGMEAPPKPTKNFDKEESFGQKAGDARLVKGRQGLFKGTYGQVRNAFRAAGLVTTPCGEDGVPNATRLGALFIANPDGRGAVVFTKVVMWG